MRVFREAGFSEGLFMKITLTILLVFLGILFSVTNTYGQIANILDTVVVAEPKLKKKQHISVFKKLSIFETQCGGWNQKAATFIPFEEENENKTISILKYATSNIGGTKGLDYLPFKANLYSVDTDTGKPKDPLIDKGIKINKNRKGKYVEINIKEYNFKIPEEGIYIVMEILPKEEYPSTFIKANLPEMGLSTISCVPAIKAYKYDKDFIRKSYASQKTYNQLVNKASEQDWYLQDCHYLMDLELN